MSKETQISTLIDSKLREEFDVAAARRRLKLKDAVAEALQLWVNNPLIENEDKGITQTGFSSAPAASTIMPVTVPGLVSDKIDEILGAAREILAVVKHISEAHGESARDQAKRAAALEEAFEETNGALREAAAVTAKARRERLARNRTAATGGTGAARKRDGNDQKGAA